VSDLWLTEEERRLLAALGEWFNAFVALPEEHPADKGEATLHVHALQNIVLARPGMRQNRVLWEAGG